MEITPQGLYEKLAKVGIDKIVANADKDDPFQTDMLELITQAEDEMKEAIQAIKKFFRKPTKQNRKEAFVEVADVANQWAFIGGKVLGFTKLQR